jgi:poly(3-hydroxybutyrate) depolymerase
VPTIVFHGTADKTVNPANADAVVRHALGGARDLERVVERGRVAGGHAYRVTRHRNGDAGTLVEDWRIEGLGHAWSGGDRKGSFTDPKGPDASRLMLEFFLRQRCGRRG